MTWQQLVIEQHQLAQEFVSKRGDADFRDYAEANEIEQDRIADDIAAIEVKIIDSVVAPKCEPSHPPRLETGSLETKWRRCVRHKEKLRLWHNIQGDRFRAGKMSEKQFRSFQKEWYRPRIAAVMQRVESLRKIILS